MSSVGQGKKDYKFLSLTSVGHLSIQWNLYKADTLGTNNLVRFRQVQFMRIWPANWNFRAIISVCFRQVSALKHVRFGQVLLYLTWFHTIRHNYDLSTPTLWKILNRLAHDFANLFPLITWISRSNKFWHGQISSVCWAQTLSFKQT